MKQYSITKEKIIEAVLTEPLRAGAFFSDNENSTDRKTCEVCAVGAVMRATIKSGLKEASGGTATEWLFLNRDLDEAYLGYGNFLSILSCEFGDYWMETIGLGEMLTKKQDIEIRMHLLNVIEAHCPEIVTFEA